MGNKEKNKSYNKQCARTTTITSKESCVRSRNSRLGSVLNKKQKTRKQQHLVRGSRMSRLPQIRLEHDMTESRRIFPRALTNLLFNLLNNSAAPASHPVLSLKVWVGSEMKCYKRSRLLMTIDRQLQQPNNE